MIQVALPVLHSTHISKSNSRPIRLRASWKKSKNSGVENPSEIQIGEVGNNQIEIQILEDGDSNRASEEQIKRWMKGRCRLWNANYLAVVVAMQETIPNITEELKRERK
jgi:hypothetical protein